MGRQIQFHALSEDLQKLLQFIHQRDPVIIVLRDSETPKIKAVLNPALETNVMTLWNQSLVSFLKRKEIQQAGRKYFIIDPPLPTLELSPPRLCEWNGRNALLAGRIYGTFNTKIIAYEKWFNSLVRWIRKNFAERPLPLIEHVGPAAYNWYKSGGVLLPMMIPPAVTPTWLSWLKAQDQHRRLFVK